MKAFFPANLARTPTLVLSLCLSISFFSISAQANSVSSQTLLRCQVIVSAATDDMREPLAHDNQHVEIRIADELITNGSNAESTRELAFMDGLTLELRTFVNSKLTAKVPYLRVTAIVRDTKLPKAAQIITAGYIDAHTREDGEFASAHIIQFAMRNPLSMNSELVPAGSFEQTNISCQLYIPTKLLQESPRPQQEIQPQD
jgi:hypothetical protein